MSYERTLGNEAVDDIGMPVNGQPQPPIWPLIIGSHGGYMEVRSTPADGACGVGTYPCKHPGIDVFGMQGTEVRAPENGTVVLAADGSSSPVGGYGPWVIIIQGDGGRFHLLGHLDPFAASSPLGAQVSAGDVVGVTSSANHTHWEVRRTMIPDFANGESNQTNNFDPVQWLHEQAGFGAIGSIVLLGAAAVLFWMLWRK